MMITYWSLLLFLLAVFITLSEIRCSYVIRNWGLSQKEEAWVNWKTFHLKNYKTPFEEAGRYQAWSENFKNIVAHNERFDAGKELYRKVLNSFCDFPPSDTIARMTWIFPSYAKEREVDIVKIKEPNVPSFVDWRLANGVLSEVQFQGGFPFGWLFAAVEVVQSQIFIRRGFQIRLSPQELLDCVTPFGYQLGSVKDALFYIRDQGISQEDIYPFIQHRFKYCSYLRQPVPVGIKSIHQLAPGDEENLKRAVALIGPIAVKIHVTQNFVTYSDGIFYDTTCEIDHPTNHAVVIVGYGKDSGREEYWVIKNSWGAFWGENGYMRMARNTFYDCGIASSAVFPILYSSY